jgi:hypothetical protein
MSPAERRSLAPWLVTFLCAAIAAATIASCLWKLRTPRDPLQRTVSRLATLDPVRRSKICAHRTNNVPKYREAIGIFDCVELDVVLEPPTGGPPAVYHPPDSNHHGLSLEFLLANEAPPRGRLWLDVKDLDDDNWRALLAQLGRQVPASRRGDTIVETGWSEPAAADAAAAFRNEGFLFSYYLPTEAAIACGSDRTEECDALRAQVLATINMGFSHLSFDARAWEFVQTLRGGLPRSVRLLTWHIGGTWPLPELIDEVDVYIVRLPSPYST